MSISGMCVALSSALIYDKKAVVLSVLGTYLTVLCWIIYLWTECKETCLYHYKI